ncbi:MAG: hypothetical protein KatS3mg111_3649 [Pirellulaceae bacterium]|nr:MAG: hypothetical protein KatS3mg111_3649 [Pirellulaceae bacterium]
METASASDKAPAQPKRHHGPPVHDLLPSTPLMPRYAMAEFDIFRRGTTRHNRSRVSDFRCHIGPNSTSNQAVLSP